ncbi:MAG: hypothetical protein ACTSRI_15345 [Promethearchaeota archaeon]
MISRILVIAPGGLLCYSKVFFGKFEIEDDLISGFLTAISNFAEEIKGGQIDAMNFRNFNYIYAYDSELEYMFVLVIDIDDPEDVAKNKVESMKNEFIKRYHKILKNWTGDVSLFSDFDEFVEDNMYIPPKILLVGENGVGKTTIMDLFPGETILELDEDLNDIIQKSISLSNLKNMKTFVIREIDLEDLVNNSKIYRQLLDSVDIICIVTNSAASNLARTKELYSRIKTRVKKPDFYVIANCQDLKSTSFEPEKIKEAFGLKTYGFSAIQKDSKKKILSIISEMLKTSVLEKIEKKT